MRWRRKTPPLVVDGTRVLPALPSSRYTVAKRVCSANTFANAHNLCARPARKHLSSASIFKVQKKQAVINWHGLCRNSVTQREVTDSLARTPTLPGAAMPRVGCYSAAPGRSLSSNCCFRSRPQRYPPKEPSLRKTRWQGIRTAMRFRPQAEATARTALGSPSR